MQPLLLSSILLAVLVAAGVLVIMKIKLWWQGGPDDRGDWENTIAAYKNLRDRGMLSDEEYRKIRTLVEPHVQPMPMAPSRPMTSAGQPATGSNPVEPSEEPN